MPDITRSEAADAYINARRQYGHDSPEAEYAAEVLDRLLTHPLEMSTGPGGTSASENP
ncbi:hypothetical protein ACWDBD_37155 [Streptomyces sp. NPDC001118]